MLEAVLATVVVAVLTTGGRWLWERHIFRRQKQELILWLYETTRDEPGQSHRTIEEAAAHLGVSSERVDRLVARCESVLRSRRRLDQISVLRVEPQSIYEKRRPIVVG